LDRNVVASCLLLFVQLNHNSAGTIRRVPNVRAELKHFMDDSFVQSVKREGMQYLSTFLRWLIYVSTFSTYLKWKLILLWMDSIGSSCTFKLWTTQALQVFIIFDRNVTNYVGKSAQDLKDAQVKTVVYNFNIRHLFVLWNYIVKKYIINSLF